MKSNFKPLGDRILVRPDSKNEEKKSKGGLILTDSINRGQKVYGKVVSIGTGIFSQAGARIPTQLAIGDTVLYKKNESTDTIKIDDEELLIFHEHELIGFIR
jgi:chaperonin GroES|tara:strand:- start:1329 stop:1634 length:306 start_codon:yes stop_codon:yes gene_type:complete